MKVPVRTKKKMEPEERMMEVLPEMEVTEEDLKEIDRMLNERGRERRSAIDVLHDMQDKYYYLPKELLEIVSRELEIPFNQAVGIGTFFDAFFMKPLGKYRVDTCMGTTCYNENASEILGTLENYIGVEPGETREDGLFTLLEVHCIGCCAIAPALRINDGTNDVIHGYLTPEKAVNIVKEIEELEAKKFEITDELIQSMLNYIKKKRGKISPSKAAKDLGLEEDQFEEVIQEMKERRIIK